MMIWKILPVFAAVAVLAGCGGGGGGGDTSGATIIGRVVQATTFLPVENAIVSVSGGGTGYTDSAGSFSITARAIGAQLLTVKASGFQDNVVNINLTPGNNVISDPIKMVVLSSTDPPPPIGPGTLGGIITLVGQSDASGVVVSLLESGVLYDSQTTTSSGTYMIWAPVGNYTLRVEKTGFQSFEDQVQITDMATTIYINVALQRL